MFLNEGTITQKKGEEMKRKTAISAVTFLLVIIVILITLFVTWASSETDKLKVQL